MQGLVGDANHGIRALLRAPIVTVTAIATIGIGAGANATVASFIDALLFRAPAQVSDPATLVSVYTSDYSSGPFGSTSGPDYESIVAETTAFSAIAAYADNPGAVVTIGSAAERISHSPVTANFFDVLGVRPALGRFFTERDAVGADAPVAVIGYDLWQRAFAGSTTALGATIAFDARTYTIIGIAPLHFEGLDVVRAREIWTLVPRPPADPAARGNRELTLVARLAAATSLQQAQEQLNALAGRLAREHPTTNLGTLADADRPRPFLVTPYTRIGAEFRSQVTMISAVLVSASLLVLVIASANVGNLLLARSTARQRELAIRLAIGASRGRIVRQLLFESVFLGVAGGGAGVLFALWTADVLPSFFPPEQVRLLQAQIDVRVLTFCIAASLVTSLVFGLAPAIQALRPSPAGVLRRESSSTSESRWGSRTRRGFVIVQVTLAFVLLVGAGLLVKSLRNSFSADLGFETRHGVVISVDLAQEVTSARGLTLYDDILQRVQSVPGIERVAFATTAPLTSASRRGFRIPGYEPREGEDMEQFVNTISPSYFEVLGMPVVAGRRFETLDNAQSARVVMVNEEFARRYLGGAAVGRVVTDSSGTALEIVGVVRGGSAIDQRSPAMPVVFYPLAQTFSRSVRLIARTAVQATAVLPSVVSTVKGIGESVAVSRPTTIQGHIDEALTADRLVTSLVIACGVLALALATVGLYGMIAYSVALKTHEIGIRVALGASAQRVSQLVLKETLILTGAGTIAGAVLAGVVGALTQSMLYQVSPTDPVTYTVVPILMILVSLSAAWIPLQRALRVEPAKVLRQL